MWYERRFWQGDPMRTTNATAIHRVTETTAAETARERAEPPLPRVVYTEPPFVLGQVVALAGDNRVTVRINGEVRDAALDASVDPQLLQEAIRSGARVVVETGVTPLVVGLLCTQRALTIDRSNRVSARLESLKLDVQEKLLLKTPLSFLKMDARGEVELFGERLVSRARKLAKILAAHISLN